ncbi:MAG: FecR domain-containing protein [Proteobacteria bacterium]|nr:FecR domain-containing protein [Pseudomonadota bacterium]
MFIESPPPTIENSPPVDAEAVELAQAGTGVAAAIGKVSSVIGTVFITHPDGTRVQATDGMPILQGDVIETTGDGAIGITFIDESTFSLAEEGRMTIDEMVYDANTQTGRAVFGIAEGVFTFVSGQIAKTAVDAMIINTPLATIGIRGTAGGGKAGPEGTLNTYSMFGEEGGAVGEMVIKTLGGTQTLNGINQTTQFSNAYVPPTIPVALPAAATQAFYGSAAAAAPQPVIAAPPTFAPGSAEANAAEAAQAAFQATIDAGGSLDSAISGAVDGAAKSNFEAVLAADPLFFGTTAAHNSVIEGERGEIIGKVAGTRGD